MKILAILLSIGLLVATKNSKQASYTASTPADPLVRTFLGIPPADSIDFIRWKLVLADASYSVECNYGIGKPNTNGFYNGGTKITFSGTVKKEKNYYTLQRDDKVLRLVELNNNLLHVVNNDHSLLVGGGGWSYALNNLMPSPTSQVSITATQTLIKDSIVFLGRTPCGIPGLSTSGQCYKLKWYLVFRSDNTYRVLGTGFRAEGGRKGKWEVSSGNGRIVYRLLDENGRSFIRLLKLDEGVLIFTDREGNLLVGDHDFSYTLNRKF